MMNKNIQTMITFFLLMSAAFPSISVQGVLRDPLGKTVEDGDYTITFRIYNVETDGSALWYETMGNVTVQHGVFSEELGDNSDYPMDTLAFRTTYYIGVTVGSGLEMDPRTKLTTSPYSKAVFGEENVFPSYGSVGVGTTSPDALVHMIENTSNSTQDLLLMQNSDLEDQLRIENDGALTITTDENTIGIGTDDLGAVIHVVSSGSGQDMLHLEDADGVALKVEHDGTLTISTDGGAIGIGTDDPEAVIHVESSESGQDMLLVKDSDGVEQVKIDSYGDMTITSNIIIGSNAAIQFSDGTTLVSSDFAGPSSSVLTPADADINADYASVTDTTGSGGDGIGDINFKINGVTKASILNNGNAEFGGALDVTGAATLSSTLDVTGAATLSSTLDVTEATILSSTLDVTGNVSTDGTVTWSSGSSANANTAYGWGNHADGGYMTSYSLTSTPDFNTVKYNNAIDNKFFRVGVPYYMWGSTDGGAASQLQWWYNDPESSGYNSVMVLLGGNGGAGWSNTSDRRLKQDITDYPNALEKVLSLRPVTYRWKTHPDADPFPGFIAQEVQEIFPEFVNIISKEGGLGMNYGRLVVPIVKAIQDQQEIIAQQGKDIQALINRIEALEAMN